MSTEALIAADFAHPCFLHQMREFESNCDTSARALAWSMRTGKSKATIDKASHLYTRGKIDGLLIFAPNGVHANWVDVELPKHAWPTAQYDPLVWRSSGISAKARARVRAADRREWSKKRAAWYDTLRRADHSPRLMVLAVNTESMTREDVRKAVAYFLKRRRRVYVVFDESDDFGTPGAKRTKMARALARRCAYKTILSGTMTTSSPLVSWSQFELLKPGALGFDTFKDFRNRYAIYEQAFRPGGGDFKKLIGFKNLEELRDKMAAWTSVVLREDCDDMPELEQEDVKIEPTKQQRAAYRELLDSFIAQLGDEEVSIGEKCAKLGKLQQIFSGFLIDEFGELHRVPGDNPRLDALAREVYHAPGKVVIWCNFQQDMDNVASRLALEGIESVEYHGRVPDKVKPLALHSFREKRAVKAFIGHPKSAGRGLDFSVASTIIWYSHTFSARDRVQAMERATKVGGRNIKAVDFIAPGPDSYILNTTRKRIEIADSLSGKGLKSVLEGLRL